MPQAPDIAVYDRTGETVLIAEVKSKPDSSPEWAALLRQNLAAYGLPSARYFMVATPDRLYFWSRKPFAGEPIPPDIWVETGEIFEPYLRRAQASAGSLSGSSLELIVGVWLNELLRGSGINRLPANAAEWLRKEGLLDAIRGGRLEQQ